MCPDFSSYPVITSRTSSLKAPEARHLTLMNDYVVTNEADLRITRHFSFFHRTTRYQADTRNVEDVAHLKHTQRFLLVHGRQQAFSSFWVWPSKAV
jgi:hypothetical protein